MSEVRTKNKYDENVELIRRYRAGAREVGEEIAELNRPLVLSIASRFSGRGVEIDELCEIGNIGLVKALNTFDTERGCAFSTYAVPLIFGEIRRFLRDDGMIKVSREEKRLLAEISRERERRLTLGLDASLSALSEAMGLSISDIASAMHSGAPVRSLDECAYSDDDAVTLGSTVYDEDDEARNFDRLSLRFAIEGLNEFERKLITLRYFRDYSQTECASVLGVTQVKISREEKKILSKLRESIG